MLTNKFAADYTVVETDGNKIISLSNWRGASNVERMCLIV